MWGLPQSPEAAAASVDVSDSAKARAADRAQEQLEGKRVTVGQLVEAGVHKVRTNGVERRFMGFFLWGSLCYHEVGLRQAKVGWRLGA